MPPERPPERSPERPPTAGGWIDVTWPIRPEMTPWPGQPPTTRERVGDLDAGDGANVSVLRLSVHSGTHMDAPLHFLPGDLDITAAPVEAMFGPVRVAEIPGAAITEAALEAFEARAGALGEGDRVFFRTANSARDWSTAPFDENYVAVAPDAARALAARGVRVVGVDYLSVGPFADPAPTHRILLGARVWVIEGLDLRRAPEGRYEMAALPLKIAGADAAPVRVLLRPLPEG